MSDIGFVVPTAMTVAAVDAVDQAVDEASDNPDEDLGRLDGSATDDILAEGLTVDLGRFEVAEDEYGVCRDPPAADRNHRAGETFTYDIQVEAVDESGKRIVDDMVVTSAFGAGQSQDLDLFEFVEGYETWPGRAARLPTKSDHRSPPRGQQQARCPLPHDDERVARASGGHIHQGSVA